MSAPGMTAVEVLRAARERIARPESWTQGSYARAGEHGVPTWWDDPQAHCFCALGAIRNVVAFTKSLHDEDERAVDLFQQAAGANIIDFNDSHTRAEVLDVFDRAIGLATDELRARLAAAPKAVT